MKNRYPRIFSKIREDLLVAQKGLCGICSRKRRLKIDHNHATGMIRGLLCNGCNLWLGRLENRLGFSFKNYLDLYNYLKKLSILAKEHMENIKIQKINSALLKEANKPIKVHCVDCRKEVIILSAHQRRAVCAECNGKLK